MSEEAKDESAGWMDGWMDGCGSRQVWRGGAQRTEEAAAPPLRLLLLDRPRRQRRALAPQLGRVLLVLAASDEVLNRRRNRGEDRAAKPHGQPAVRPRHDAPACSGVGGRARVSMAAHWAEVAEMAVGRSAR